MQIAITIMIGRSTIKANAEKSISTRRFKTNCLFMPGCGSSVFGQDNDFEKTYIFLESLFYL